jgi:hypothetical protein
VHSTFSKLARVGYATKGLLYLVIGGLAVLHAAGEGGALLGSRGAVSTVAKQQGLGWILIWATGIGLASFAAWRFLQAAFDPESSRRDLVQAGRRVGYAFSGLVHAGLAIAAFQLALGQGKPASERTYLTKLFHMPAGHALAAILGVIIVGVAVRQIYLGVTGRFMRELDTGAMSGKARTWAHRTGSFGLTAYGTVLGVVGYFLIRAAASGHSSQARTSAGALHEIARSPSGTWLLASVALGLLGYALHMFFEARYRHIEPRAA